MSEQVNRKIDTVEKSRHFNKLIMLGNTLSEVMIILRKYFERGDGY